MKLALVFVLALVAPASADLRWGVHLGGGLEGGTITGAPRPDGVMEAGMSVEALLPGKNWGFGLTAEAVGRWTPSVDAREEAKFDLTWRWATANRRMRGGAGAGIRMLTIGEPRERAQTVMGIDLMRLDVDLEIVRWTPARAPTIGLDVYASWTFGCYSDTYEEKPIGDMKPVSRALQCTDTITTTYVAGLKTSVSWR